MKQLTLQDMFKKIRDCPIGKGENTGSHCSISSMFQVKQMLINVFNY
jgi:hypothetical protein